jgi:hypothetical protein
MLYLRALMELVVLGAVLGALASWIYIKGKYK